MEAISGDEMSAVCIVREQCLGMRSQLFLLLWKLFLVMRSLDCLDY